MRAPAFWQQDGAWAHMLAPMSAVVSASTARRVARAGWRAPVPVLCCGNAGVGGAGKTTLALDVAKRLQRRGARVAFLTRGYGGQVKGTARVDARHDAHDVGDEALLLAEVAPTLVGADRAASARVAVAQGATVLVMDDGLQNPGLEKDLSLPVIDGAAGFGNGRVLPAGPLREPVLAAAGRCQAAVMIGVDAKAAAAALPPGLPVLRATLRPDTLRLAGRTVFAFAGIGRPEKFFETVREAGAVLAGQRSFPDHHRYRTAELEALWRSAVAAGAALVTTPKDEVRLPRGWAERVEVAGVSLQWADDGPLEALLGMLT